MDLLRDCMLVAAEKQAEIFSQGNLGYCEMLVDGNARRNILMIAYRRLVREGKLSPIENLERKQKEEAYQVAKDIAKGRMGTQGLIEVVKALLTIEYFLNKEVN